MVKDNSFGIAELQDKMLDILKLLINICEKNQFEYWLAGGSCIGALRHQGFIPWDDDLDIYMPRQAYEKMWELYKNRIIFGHYKLCRTTFHKNYHHRVMQLVDIDTTFINERSINENIEHGVYIDIIPIDACANGIIGRFNQCIDAVLFSVYNIQCKQEFNGGKLTRYINIGTTILLNAVKNPQKRYEIWKKSERRMTKYDWNACKEYIVLTSTVRELKNPFPKEWLKHRVARFEDINVNIMSGSEEYCHMMYGDYMKLPPRDEQHVKHKTVFIDIHNSYEEYKGIYYCKDAK